MSSQRGNVSKSGPPKYKNATAFVNNKYDKSKQIEKINHLDLSMLCQRCEDIMKWKVKYKKYKPLTQSKKCLKCDQKRVKRAYHTVCEPCGKEFKICCKCGEQKDIVTAITKTDQEAIQREFEAALPHLRERDKRTLLRLAEKGEDPATLKSMALEKKKDLEGDDSDSEEDFSDSDLNSDQD